MIAFSKFFRRVFQTFIKLVDLMLSYVQSIFRFDYNNRRTVFSSQAHTSFFKLKNFRAFFLSSNFQLSNRFLIQSSILTLHRKYIPLNLVLEKFARKADNQLNIKETSLKYNNYGNAHSSFQKKHNSFSSHFHKIYENRSVFISANNVFKEAERNAVHVDSLVFGGHRSISKYLTSDGKLNFNFQALENFRNYLSLADLSFLSEKKVDRKRTLRKSRDRNLKRFKRIKSIQSFQKYNEKLHSIQINQNGSKSQNASRISQDSIFRTRDLLTQINFLLKHKDSILSGDVPINVLNLSKEVSDVLFSFNTPLGAYGPDTSLYSADMHSATPLNVVRRISLFSDAKVDNIDSFKRDVGFFNFGTVEQEEFESSSDVSLGGLFSGQMYSINPFLVLGLVIYSFFELFLIFYFVSCLFGTPYQTINFFFKYSSAYFYENLSGFPSANYFFFALAFWLMVFVMFSNFLLELLDEERFNPPKISWLLFFFKEFAFDFVFFGCIIFCIVETVLFMDLLLTRFFFIGTPGFPQLFVSFFLLLYEIFFILGATNYFTLYLEFFVFFDIKFPVFYYSDFVPLLKRFPLVQPSHMTNFFDVKPNFFLWLFDFSLQKIFSENSKSFFFSEQNRFIFQRELVQDIRKYNYLRKNLADVKLIGQLFLRGLNGFNYRLDLKYINAPILPEEQVIRFDWRFKNSHFDGLNSRLFRPDFFQASSVRSFPLFKRLTFFKHRLKASGSRHGYLEYLTASPESKLWSGNDPVADVPDDYLNRLLIRSSVFSRIPNSQRQYYRFRFNKQTSIKPDVEDGRFNFLFSPTEFKFYNMKELNNLIPSKTQRNFNNSRLLLNDWSFVAGNTKPRLPFKYRTFIPLSLFTKISFWDYLPIRSQLNENYFRFTSFLSNNESVYSPLHRKSFRSLFLTDPHMLFKNRFSNSRTYKFATPVKKNLVESSIKNSNLYDDLLMKNQKGVKKETNSIVSLLSSPEHLKKKQILSSALVNREKVSLVKDQIVKKKSSNRFVNKFVRSKKLPSLQGARVRIPFKELPNFSYNPDIKKYHSIAWFFINQRPSYYLRPLSVFTTFSQLNFSFNKNVDNYRFSSYKFSFFSSLSSLYFLNLFFFGFHKMSKYDLQLFSFDYYYAQNHNFFRSVLDFYLKSNQFITIPTSKGRFASYTNGGIRHSLDFMFPMISELRLKEKLIPINFSYDTSKIFNWNLLDFDPYYSIRNSTYSKGSCYFLDARIQNWFLYQNVLWNEYYHFFFNRSFKTEGNGSKFVLSSFNPINGPLSYKLYINSPTLEISRVGQYFYNYIPWLQYKFKWLLYPTSTYKRFDSFRHVQQHSNRKFYFSSLLKFYQINLFRWQQASGLFVHKQTQLRNFFIHLFFHKYKILSDLKHFRDFCISNFEQFHLNFSSVDFLSQKINLFNVSFLQNSDSNSKISTVPSNELFPGRKVYELFLPTFTFGDFKFLQNVLDFRRWKSLQTNYLRDWKFDNYIKYLGPLLYKHDTASLMGFFAPFEYRNQIFVTKMRNDALRFSVFFPKKIIVEENPFLDNPRFPKSILQKEKIRSSIFPSLYATYLNKSFVRQMSNYSYFFDTKIAKRNKLFLKGLYSHLQRLNLNSKVSLNQGSGFVDTVLSTVDKAFTDMFYGFFSFNDLNSKKQRMHFDKIYWLSKGQEIKQIGLNSKKVLFGEKGGLQTSVSSFSLAKLTPQFGKSLDVIIPILPPKLEFFQNKSIFLDFKNSFVNKDLSRPIISTNDSFEIMSFLNPNIYLSFGGPKGLSAKWHRGQSWLKFVIASQNTSTLPLASHFQYESDESREKFTNRLPGGNSFSTPRHRKISGGIEDSQTLLSESTFPQNSSFIFDSLNGKHQSPNFVIPESSGYFNFGLSGIGRLPRLSRSFFHALFSRNKLEDFAKLKRIYLKFYLMSIPLFQDTQFKNNSSFFMLWYSLFCSHYLFAVDSFRYNVLFNFFLNYQYHFDFSKFLNIYSLGTLSEGLFISSSETFLLKNQYSNLKSYERFIFFTSIPNYDQKFSKSLKTSVLKILSTKSQISSYLIFLNNWFFLFFQRFSVSFSALDKICYFSFLSFHDLFGTLYLLASYPFSYVLSCLKWVFFDDYFLSRRKGVFYRSLNDNHLFFLNYHDFNTTIFSKKTYLMENYSFFSSSSSLFQNPFSYFFDATNFLGDMEKKIFLGSFRSRLNWFIYPVHFFLYSSSTTSSYFSNSLFFLVNFSLNSFLKYNSVISYNLLLSSPFLSFGFFDKRYVFFNDFGSIFVSGEQSNDVANLTHVNSLNTIDPSSYFVKKIFSFYTDFFSLANSFSSFRVKLFFRFNNFSYFNSLFLFQNSSKMSFKFSNVFNIFFFSPTYLESFSFFQNSLNLQFISSDFFFLSNYFFNSEKFFDNVFHKARSLDGSGRYTRPRGELYTLNKVFSYREFEKYRHEHHRQRFRSVIPHWVQNSLKNRYNFTRYLSSPQRRHKLKLQRLALVRNFMSTAARTRNSPSFFNRISSLNYFLDNKILSQVLKLNESLAFPSSKKLVSSPSPIQITDTNFNFQSKKLFMLSGVSPSDNFPKQILKSFKSQFFRLKELKNFRSQIRHSSNNKNFLASRVFFTENEKFSSFLPELYQSLFLNHLENSERETVVEQKLEINNFFKDYGFSEQTKTKKESSKKSLVPRVKTSLWYKFRRHEFFSQNSSRGQDLVFWRTHFEKKFFQNFKFSDLNLNHFLKFSDQKKNKLFARLMTKQFFSSDLLFGLPAASQTNSVTTLRLLNQQFSFNKLFSQSFEHSSKKFYKSDSRSITEKVKWNKYGYFPLKTKQQETYVRSFFSSSENFNKSLENSRKIQPRFYKSYLYNSSLGTVNPSVGGFHFVNKYAPYKYMLFTRGNEESGEKVSLKKILRFSSRKRPSNKAQTLVNSVITENSDYGNSRKWFLPNNVRRFLRPYNKVLMSMPYLYSKWYTQNPRLSLGINSEFLDLFVNHNYAEFNTICVQSLFILKRKIMFNVVSLKLVSLKSKLLYFSHFDTLFPYEYDFSNNKNSKNFLVFFSKYVNILLTFLNFDFDSVFYFLYQMYIYFSEKFFSNHSFYAHLLNNILIKQYKHDSVEESFLNSFYHNYAAKRLLAQIGVSTSTVQGWDNPIGIFGQYMAGLNFYIYKFPFNFSYQYPDFFSGRSFSPEFLLLNNLYRKNNQYYSRELFFGEYPVNSNYRPSYHFLTFRILSPLSPFVEYQLPLSRVFTSNAKQRRWRLPNLSLRRVHDIYPSHLSAFFNILQTEKNTITGHDITLPLKLKFLSFNFRNNDANFRRKLERSFVNSNVLLSLDSFLIDSLNFKQFNALSALNSKLNFSNLVNTRRFSLKLRQWSPIHFNFYYLFNWKSFLHKFYYSDNIGVRNYKLNSFFDMYQGFIPLTLKAKSFQHLIISQIPRAELDSRRKVPSVLSLKQFVVLFQKYFSYVNENFYDTGYFSKEQKILRYVNRKLHPFLLFSLPSKNSFFPLFLDLGFSPEITKKENSHFSFFSKKRRNVSNVFSPSKFYDSPVYLRIFSINNLIKMQKEELFFPSAIKKRVRLFHKVKSWFNFFPSVFRQLTTKTYTFRSLFFSKFYKFSLSSSFSYYKKRLDFYLFNQSPFRFGVLNNFDSVYNLYKRSSKSLDFGYLKEKKTRFSYNSLKPLVKKYVALSRILSVLQIFDLKKRKERGLNPLSWLHFDFFSRIRPAFKPFLFKFSNVFSFSQILPKHGYSSYNFQVKSHTEYDNFFDRHPYISFGIGSFSENSLLFSESAYKEVRKRSHLFDFSKRLDFVNGPNRSTNARFQNDSLSRYSRVFSEYEPFNKDKIFYSRHSSSGNFHLFFGSTESSSGFSDFQTNLINPKFSKWGDSEDLDSRVSTGFPFIRTHYFPAGPELNSSKKTKEDSEIQSTRRGLSFYPLKKSFLQIRRNFQFRFDNFYKNSIIQSFFLTPRRKALLLNTQLLRPYTMFLKWTRIDNSVLHDFKFFRQCFDFFGYPLNSFRNSSFRAYYQPNLKVFFDYNAFKQRYNLALLFRELSFDNDFQLFLFQRKRFFLQTESLFSNYVRSDKDLINEFLILKDIDLYQLFYGQKLNQYKNDFFDLKLNYYFSQFFNFFYKINFLYVFIFFFNFFLGFFFSFFYMIKMLHFFDFSFFFNLFPLGFQDFLFYDSRNSVFQLFFHLAVFKEYAKFTWLFSLKFLIFNFEYYFYYFIFFWFILVSRLISLRIKRSNFVSPFLVPYSLRFSDFKLNSYSGWFETAWKEVQNESIEQLALITHSRDIPMLYSHPMSASDVEQLKKKYKISTRQPVEDFDGSLIDDQRLRNKFNNESSSVPFFLKLKKTYGKLGYLNFLKSTIKEKQSLEFQFEEFNSFHNFSNQKNYLASLNLPKDSTDLVISFPMIKAFSFKIFFRTLFLFLTRRIRFLDFIRIFNLGKSFPSHSDSYKAEDFESDFDTLFVPLESRFSETVEFSLKGSRMLPEDENIHFYRKPSAFSELENSKHLGTETEQFHFVLEFPGRFGNSHLNTFSRLHSIRNLSYNNPQFGFFSFSKNAKLPQTFDEFLVFFSLQSQLSNKQTSNPFFSAQLNRYYNLWSLFQHVIRYDYNLAYYYDLDDIRSSKDRSFISRDLLFRTSLLDNFKFWVNKASNDAIDFNFFNPYFFLPNTHNTLVHEKTPFDKSFFANFDSIDNFSELTSKKSFQSLYDRVNIYPFSSEVQMFEKVTKFSFSLLYMFYTYLFLFVFFLILVLFFCCFFLFFVILFNYFSIILW